MRKEEERQREGCGRKMESRRRRRRMLRNVCVHVCVCMYFCVGVWLYGYITTPLIYGLDI